MTWLQFVILIVYFGAFLALIGKEVSRISGLLEKIREVLSRSSG